MEESRTAAETLPFVTPMSWNCLKRVEKSKSSWQRQWEEKQNWSPTCSLLLNSKRRRKFIQNEGKQSLKPPQVLPNHHLRRSRKDRQQYLEAYLHHICLSSTLFSLCFSRMLLQQKIAKIVWQRWGKKSGESYFDSRLVILEGQKEVRNWINPGQGSVKLGLHKENMMMTMSST